MADHLLSILVFSPLVGVAAVLLIPGSNDRLLKITALFFTLITFAISLPLAFDDAFAASGALQYREMVEWIGISHFFSINYHVAVDGISLWLIMLTTLLMPLVVLASWNSIDWAHKGFLALLMLLETGLLGAFVAHDLMLFYIFWELTLLPLYFMIGIWGRGQRIQAALKFFLYSAVGSLLLLVAIIALYYHAVQQGVQTNGFDIQAFYQLDLPYAVQFWLFLAFVLSLAIKVPLFPLHTWMPAAQSVAPTAVSAVLLAVLLKLGCYAYVRFALPLCSAVLPIFAPLLIFLCVLAILYGSVVSMVQESSKMVVAYSTLGQLGFILLGVLAMNQQGLSGGMIQMLSHGVSAAALLFTIGFLEDRRDSCQMDRFGGLAAEMPLLALSFLIIICSAIGVPGSSGFVGEFLVLTGAFKGGFYLSAVLAGIGIIFTAASMLRMYQRLMLGPATPTDSALKDLSLREVVIMVPLLVLIFWIGIYPTTFLNKMTPALDENLKRMGRDIDIVALQVDVRSDQEVL